MGNTNTELFHFTSLTEAGLQISDKKQKRIRLRLIKSGRSQRGNVYSPDVLKEAASLFKGVKMYIDHPDESKINKPRSLRDWAGTIIEANYNEQDKAIDGIVGIRAKFLWELIEAGNDEDWLNEIGSSINAAGPTRIGQHDGQRSNIVESIKVVRSVDFVPEASAGGHIQQVLESKLHAQEDGIMELTLQELMDGFPELVEAIQDATLESAQIDIEFIGSLIESGLQNETTACVILESVAASEDAMDAMVEGIEAARTEELGYNFSSLEEVVVTQQDQLKATEASNKALQESVQQAANVDMAAFELKVRESEAAYWQDHYKKDLQESATGDPDVLQRLHSLETSNVALTEENEQLRTDFATITSKATAMSMLKESGLPTVACNRILPHMVGRTESEMKRLVEDKRTEIAEYTGSDGTVKGGSHRSTPTELKENAQQRVDSLFGYDDIQEAGEGEGEGAAAK